MVPTNDTEAPTIVLEISAKSLELEATTTWMPLWQEPSLTSMKQQSFYARQLFTHPATLIYLSKNSS